MIINTAQGGGGSSLEVFNFPVTISLTAPTPISTGHLWVVHDGPVDFSSVVLDDAVKVDYSNGYLMLIVDDTNNGQDTITQLKKIGGAKIPLTSRRDTGNDTVLPWQVGSVNKSGNIIDIKRKYPRVYSRLNDVLDMETAYVWDGTQWVMVSQKGSYLAVGTNNTSAQSFLYNRVDESLSLHSGLPDFPASVVNCVKFSHDGQSVFYGLSISPWLVGYKRSGDLFTKLTLSMSSILTVYDISFSPDDAYLAVAANGYSCIYKRQSDETYAFLTNLVSTTATHYFYGCDWSPDGNYCVFTSDINPCIRRFKRTGDTFTQLANPSTLPQNTCYKVKYSPDGQFVAARTSGSPYLLCYHIVSDTQWDILSYMSYSLSVSTFQNIVFTSDGYLLTPNASGSSEGIMFFTYSASGLVYVTKQLINNPAFCVAITMDKTKLAVGFVSSPYLRWYSLSGTDLTELSAPDTLPTAQVYALDFIN